jgi:zinc finger SWIM domain-containing protein 3
LQSYFDALRKLLQPIGYRGDDKREDTFIYSRPETQCGCTACINGFYDVYEFEESYNHILAPGTMAHFLRSQRKVTEAQIANAEVAKSIGISTKATIDLMAKEACGIENLGCTHEDMKNSDTLAQCGLSL